MLLYTDGLVEVRRDIVEGLETLARVAGEAAGLELGGGSLDAVLAGAAQGDPIGDDTLLLALRWRPPPQGAAVSAGAGPRPPG